MICNASDGVGLCQVQTVVLMGILHITGCVLIFLMDTNYARMHNFVIWLNHFRQRTGKTPSHVLLIVGISEHIFGSNIIHRHIITQETIVVYWLTSKLETCRRGNQGRGHQSTDIGFTRTNFYQAGMWGWFNIKLSSYQYRKSHCRDKTIFRPSYLHNGISCTGKMISLYWTRALLLIQIPLRLRFNHIQYSMAEGLGSWSKSNDAIHLQIHWRHTVSNNTFEISDLPVICLDSCLIHPNCPGE